MSASNNPDAREDDFMTRLDWKKFRDLPFIPEFTTCRKDWAWAGEILDAASDSFDRFDRPVYVMGDFKFDNLLVRRSVEQWELSGLFDFTNGYFGDGAADLTKIATQFIDRGRSDLAERFLRAYRDGLDDKEGFDQRIKVHMLHQKVLDWGCFHAIGAVSWNPEWTFRDWASRYIGL
ncbi:phosphotransferase family protein [Paenibacillus sp. D51F]